MLEVRLSLNNYPVCRSLPQIVSVSITKEKIFWLLSFHNAHHAASTRTK